METYIQELLFTKSVQSSRHEGVSAIRSVVRASRLVVGIIYHNQLNPIRSSVPT